MVASYLPGSEACLRSSEHSKHVSNLFPNFVPDDRDQSVSRFCVHVIPSNDFSALRLLQSVPNPVLRMAEYFCLS